MLRTVGESRRISGLEKAIGLRLLHRTTRQIEPTEAGQLYFERCKRIVAEARLAHEQLGEMVAQPSGVLRASLRQYLPGTVDCRIRPTLPRHELMQALTSGATGQVGLPISSPR